MGYLPQNVCIKIKSSETGSFILQISRSGQNRKIGLINVKISHLRQNLGNEEIVWKNSNLGQNSEKWVFCWKKFVYGKNLKSGVFSGKVSHLGQKSDNRMCLASKLLIMGNKMKLGHLVGKFRIKDQNSENGV